MHGLCCVDWFVLSVCVCLDCVGCLTRLCGCFDLGACVVSCLRVRVLACVCLCCLVCVCCLFVCVLFVRLSVCVVHVLDWWLVRSLNVFVLFVGVLMLLA